MNTQVPRSTTFCPSELHLISFENRLRHAKEQIMESVAFSQGDEFFDGMMTGFAAAFCLATYGEITEQAFDAFATRGQNIWAKL